MISRYKLQAEQKFQGLGRSIAFIHPNVLTLIGIIPQALFFILMRSHHLLGAALVLLLTVLDTLDGLAARANNKVTAFGGFLDSTVDRIGDFLMIAGLYAAGLASIQLTAILVLATFLISYTRSRAELASLGQLKFNYGLIERAERIAFVFLIVLGNDLFPRASLFGSSLTEILVWTLTILSIVTVLMRVGRAYSKLRSV
jgi:phosphatidylglycerophosphate synthase